MTRRTSKGKATRVRCMENARTGAKGWKFYCDGGIVAYLSASKLSQADDPYIAHALQGMQAQENRPISPSAVLYLVKGRHQWLVHRIDDGRGILAGVKSSSQNKLL